MLTGFRLVKVFDLSLQLGYWSGFMDKDLTAMHGAGILKDKIGNAIISTFAKSLALGPTPTFYEGKVIKLSEL